MKALHALTLVIPARTTDRSVVAEKAGIHGPAGADADAREGGGVDPGLRRDDELGGWVARSLSPAHAGAIAA
jgi:hypothetical protein